MKEAWVFASKAAHKVRQRVFGVGKSTDDTNVVARRVAQALATSNDVFAVLQTVDFLDHDVVGAVAAGERAVNPPSLGFLINLSGMLRFLG